MIESSAPHGPLRPDAVLLIIDWQVGFRDAAAWGPRDNPAAEANLGRLIRAWQRAERPIVLAQHDSTTPGSPLWPGSSGNRLVPELHDVVPQLLVRKSVNSVFYGTPDLDHWLQERQRPQLVLAGIQTNMCNETTARMAGNLGYDVLFVLDAMHTFDLRGPDGVVIRAQELSRTTAANLHGGGFARVVATADLIGTDLPGRRAGSGSMAERSWGL